MIPAERRAIPWLVDFAAQRGLHYEPDADERWLRVWEPFATLRVPIRYEHTLQSTGSVGSLTLARFVVPGPQGYEASAWIAIAQDIRIDAPAAATCDLGGVFGEPLDLVPMPRQATRDPAFDATFATFAATPEEAARALTPSLRRLVMTWRTPLHIETRRGGFILAPVALPADPPSLSWLLRAIQLFGEKATKR